MVPATCEPLGCGWAASWDAAEHGKPLAHPPCLTASPAQAWAGFPHTPGGSAQGQTRSPPPPARTGTLSPGSSWPLSSSTGTGCSTHRRAELKPQLWQIPRGKCHQITGFLCLSSLLQGKKISPCSLCSLSIFRQGLQQGCLTMSEPPGTTPITFLTEKAFIMDFFFQPCGITCIVFNPSLGHLASSVTRGLLLGAGGTGHRSSRCFARSISHLFKMCSDVMVPNKVNKLQADTGDTFKLAAQLAFSRSLGWSLNSACIW